MKTNRPLVLASAVIAVVAVGFLVAWRGGLLTESFSEKAARTEQRAIRDGQRRYRSVRVEPIERFADVDAVEQLLTHAIENAWPDPMPDEKRGDREEIIRQVAAVIRLRLVERDPQAFRAWREAHGWRLIDASDEEDRFYFEREYVGFFGEPYPGLEHAAQIYDRYMAHEIERGILPRAKSIAVESEGIGIVFGSVTPATIQSGFPRIDGEMARTHWYGVKWGAFEQWWKNDHGSYFGYVKSHSKTRAASLGVVLGFTGGKRFPFVFNFYYDDDRNRWWYEHTSVHNNDGTIRTLIGI